MLCNKGKSSERMRRKARYLSPLEADKADQLPERKRPYLFRRNRQKDKAFFLEQRK